MAFGDIVQTAQYSSAGSRVATADLVFGSALTPGNAIVMMACVGTADSVRTVTVPTGVTEAHATSGTPSQATQQKTGYRIVQSGDGTTWGWDFGSGGTDPKATMVGVEIEGPFDATPLDQTATGSQTSATTTPHPTGTTAATDTADEIAVGSWGFQNSPGATTYSDSFVERVTETNTGSGNDPAANMATKLLSATGTTGSDATTTNTRRSFNGVLTLRKGSAGGTTYDETGLGVTLTSTTGGVEVAVRDELGGAAAIVLATGGTDLGAFVEAVGAALALETGGGEQLSLFEAVGVVILFEAGGTEGPLYLEHVGFDMVSETGGVDVAALVEALGAELISAVGGVDLAAFAEAGGVELVLETGGAAGVTYEEHGGVNALTSDGGSELVVRLELLGFDMSVVSDGAELVLRVEDQGAALVVSTGGLDELSTDEPTVTDGYSVRTEDRILRSDVHDPALQRRRVGRT